MNTRTNQSGDTNSVAQDLVFENLGIEDQNLGNESDDFNEGDDSQDDPYEPDAVGDDGPDLEDPFLEQDPSLDGRQQQQQQRDPNQRVSHTPPSRPLPKKAEVKADAKGNLVDAQGKIVARAGSEARLYQGRQKAQRDLASANEQVTDVTGRLSKAIEIGRGLHAQVQAFNAQQEQLKQFGFDSNDQIAAMQLFSEMRKNPGATIQKLLTKAAASGITVGTTGTPGGNDTKAIADTIREILGTELKPLKEQQTAQAAERTRQEQESRQLADIQTEISTFFGRNPEAEQYLPVFKRVIADPKYSGYSLGEIYARILKANQSRPQVNGRQRPSGRTPRRGSPPNGRGYAPGNGSEMASVDESYDSILKDVMKTAGYN